MFAHFPPLPLTSHPIMRPLRSSEIESLTVNQLTAGTITAQEIILASDADGVQALIKSSNYVAGTSGWMIDSDGDAEFNDVTIRGDFYGNWNGAVPVDLSVTYDPLATDGIAIDSSEGAAQFMGDVWVGGDVSLIGAAGRFRTSGTAATGVEIRAGDWALYPNRIIFHSTDQVNYLNAFIYSGSDSLIVTGMHDNPTTEVAATLELTQDVATLYAGAWGSTSSGQYLALDLPNQRFDAYLRTASGSGQHFLWRWNDRSGGAPGTDYEQARLAYTTSGGRLSFAGDSDTYITSGGADVLSIYAGGNHRLGIHTDGLRLYDGTYDPAIWWGNGSWTSSRKYRLWRDDADFDALKLSGTNSLGAETDFLRFVDGGITFAASTNHVLNAGGRLNLNMVAGNVMNTASGDASPLQIYQVTGGAGAFMTFHVNGDFVGYFGISGALNDLAVGGWSYGANEYRVWHAGNDGPGSGLNADLLDGYSVGSFMLNANHTTGAHAGMAHSGHDFGTTATGPNLYGITTGWWRSTSTERFKSHIRPVAGHKRGNPVLNLEPVWFKSRHKADQQNPWYIGLTAEHVAATFPEAANLDETGQPQSWDTNVVLAALLAVVKEQEQRIATLEAA